MQLLDPLQPQRLPSLWAQQPALIGQPHWPAGAAHALVQGVGVGAVVLALLLLVLLVVLV